MYNILVDGSCWKQYLLSHYELTSLRNVNLWHRHSNSFEEFASFLLFQSFFTHWKPFENFLAVWMIDYVSNLQRILALALCFIMRCQQRYKMFWQLLRYNLWTIRVLKCLEMNHHITRSWDGVSGNEDTSYILNYVYIASKYESAQWDFEHFEAYGQLVKNAYVAW